jgi:precorrin-8X/cobalt-precorrin-8 methylmutase
MNYLRDPDQIYRHSWELVRAATDLASVPEELHDLAVRLVHTSGDPTIIDGLSASSGAVQIARAALATGAPLLVDVQMVAAGITRRFLPAGSEVICTLDQAGDLARELATTRSAAAVELWRPHLGGAVVAIGNAPTALFHLLELIEAGSPKPAIILGFPVGFVGATESKAALAAQTDVPFVTLAGRRGGSALAATAVNSVAQP